MISICQDPTFTNGNSHEINISHTAMTIWNSGAGGLCPNDPKLIRFPAKTCTKKIQINRNKRFIRVCLGQLCSLFFPISWGQKSFSSSLRWNLLWRFAHPNYLYLPSEKARQKFADLTVHTCAGSDMSNGLKFSCMFLLRLESLQSFPICSMEFNELTWRHCDSAVKELQDFENQVDSTFEVDKCACMRCMGASAMAPVPTQIQKLVDECARADWADWAGARPFVSRSSASTSSFFSLASSFLLATWARLVRFKASCSLQRWQNSQALPLWQPSALKEKKRQGVHLPSACILCIAKRGIGTALGSGTRSPSELTSRLSVFPAMAELPLVRPKDWQRCVGMLRKPSHFYPSSLGATCSYGWIRKFLTGRRFEKPAKVDGQMRKQPVPLWFCDGWGLATTMPQIREWMVTCCTLVQWFNANMSCWPKTDPVVWNHQCQLDSYLLIFTIYNDQWKIYTNNRRKIWTVENQTREVKSEERRSTRE